MASRSSARTNCSLGLALLVVPLVPLLTPVSVQEYSPMKRNQVLLDPLQCLLRLPADHAVIAYLQPMVGLSAYWVWFSSSRISLETRTVLSLCSKLNPSSPAIESRISGTDTAGVVNGTKQ